jgi:hypothetical protein
MKLSKYAHKQAVKKFAAQYSDLEWKNVLCTDEEFLKHMALETFDLVAAQKRADVRIQSRRPTPVVAPILTPAPITRPKPLGTIGDLVHL